MENAFNKENTNENKTSTNKNIPDFVIDKLKDDQIISLVEILLGRKELEGEVQTKVRLGARATIIRSVELDILVTGDALFNIEIENNTTELKEIVSRIRYYSSMITSEYGLKKKTDFKHIKPVTILFLTTKNFDEDSDETCFVFPEKKRVEYLDDGLTSIIMNVKDTGKLIKSNNIGRMVEAIGTKIPKEVYTELLSVIVSVVKSKEVIENRIECVDDKYIDYVGKVNNIIGGVNAMNIGERLKLEGEIKIYITELKLSIEELYNKYPKINKEKIKTIYNSIIKEEGIKVN